MGEGDVGMRCFAVKLTGVSKIYSLKNKTSKQKFYALKDISFEVQKGDIVGILGTNGSGKSTLSMLLAEIMTPDRGHIGINGKTALISIQTGLNMQLTGIENIYLKGALLGLPKDEIEKVISVVMDFSELGDFLYEPVKNYSSGMKSRLGFSISMALNPDIIIVDEALSVGDKAFADKCLKKFNELKAEGKTIFFISHSLNQVKQFCTKGLWIEDGILKAYGPIEEVSVLYSNYLSQLSKLSEIERKEYKQKIFKNRLVEDQKVRLSLWSRMLTK